MANYKRSGGSHVGAKVFTGIVTFLLLAAIVLTALSFGLGWIQLTSEENPVQEQPETEEVNGGAIINSGEENGLSLMSAKISPEDYSKYAIDPLADTAFTLTATVTPEDATDQSISLSIAFENSASEWASGKNVANYITLSSTTVQSGVPFTVTCKEAYGESIILTAKANGGENVSATATFEYAYRYSGINFINGTDYNPDLGFRLDSESITGASGNEYAELLSLVHPDSFLWDEDDTNLDWIIQPIISTGTIYEDITNLKITANSSLSNYTGIGYKFIYFSDSSSASSYGVYHFTGTSVYWADIYDMIWGFNYTGSSVNEKRDFYNALHDVDGLAAKLQFTFEGAETGTQYSFEFPLMVSNFYSLYKSATGINIGGTSDGKVIM